MVEADGCPDGHRAARNNQGRPQQPGTRISTGDKRLQLVPTEGQRRQYENRHEGEQAQRGAYAAVVERRAQLKHDDGVERIAQAHRNWPVVRHWTSPVVRFMKTRSRSAWRCLNSAMRKPRLSSSARRSQQVS